MKHFDGVLKVNGKLLTPLAQLSEKQGLKSRVFYLEYRDTHVFVEVPIFSANAVGGLLRRAGTYLLFQKALEKGYLSKLPCVKSERNPLETDGLLSLYFLYTVGGGSVISLSSGTDYSLYQTVKELKERNPFASLYGVTLNVPSKLIISDLTPFNPVSNERDRSMIENIVDNIIGDKGATPSIKIYKDQTRFAGTETIIVVDDVMRGSILAKMFLSDKSMEEWVKFNQSETIRKKMEGEKKKDGDSESKESEGEREKKGTIQNIQSAPYIPAGVNLSGEISVKEPLTLVEYGLLLNSLKILAQQSITQDGKVYRIPFGSFAKRGFGRVRLSVEREMNGESVDILAVENKSNVFDVPYVDIVAVHDLEADALDAFEEWLENMDYETFVLPLTFSQTYASKSRSSHKTKKSETGEKTQRKGKENAN